MGFQKGIFMVRSKVIFGNRKRRTHVMHAFGNLRSKKGTNEEERRSGWN